MNTTARFPHRRAMRRHVTPHPIRVDADNVVPDDARRARAPCRSREQP